MRVLPVSVATLASLALAACSAAPKSTFNDNTDPNFAVDAGGDPNNPNPSLGEGGTTPPPTGDCTDAAKLVYVIGDNGMLQSFNPGTLKFTQIGPVNCPTSSHPNSMAVSRDAIAWVNMADGSLFRVDTKDGSCTATSYQLNQQGGVIIKGMGFSTDTSGGTSETLFTCGENSDFSKPFGAGLFKITLPGMKLVPVGDYGGSLNGSECELTGTGDARLFGDFALETPPVLAELNKTSGKASGVTPMNSVPSNIKQFAFSFWGGDFWFYTDKSTGHSTVTRYKYATDKSFSKVASAPVSIVGAGVSTCAPTAPPN
jgi:hypothetical protein